MKHPFLRLTKGFTAKLTAYHFYMPDPLEFLDENNSVLGTVLNPPLTRFQPETNFLCTANKYCTGRASASFYALTCSTNSVINMQNTGKEF